jgi:hypothetical protein
MIEPAAQVALSFLGIYFVLWLGSRSARREDRRMVISSVVRAAHPTRFARESFDQDQRRICALSEERLGQTSDQDDENERANRESGHDQE